MWSTRSTSATNSRSAASPCGPSRRPTTAGGCRSGRPRRLLLFQFTAVDAWPLSGVPDLAAYDANIVRGEPVREYRLTSMHVRVPFPVGYRKGSIYEIQTALRRDAKVLAESKR